MTPEQRSKEMRRRLEKGERAKAARLKAETKTGEPPKKKRTLSPEALERIAEGNRKRWAAKKKLEKQAAKAARAAAKSAAPSKAQKNHHSKTLTPEQQKEKQKIYQARHEARKNGQPLPELPPKMIEGTIQ